MPEITSPIHEHDGFQYKLVASAMYGIGLQSRPIYDPQESENWTDVDLMPEGILEEVMKRILVISTE